MKLPAKPKRQFSKGHVVFADFLVFYVYTVSALLSLGDKQPISDIAIAIITAYGAFATGGYFALNAIRDCSINSVTKCEIEHKSKEDGFIEDRLEI